MPLQSRPKGVLRAAGYAALLPPNNESRLGNHNGSSVLGPRGAFK